MARGERIAERLREGKWQHPPLRIEMLECINCDACLRHCPPQFGAIFNHGADVIIIPELCSGCDQCLPACPVNCIAWVTPEDAKRQGLATSAGPDATCSDG
jgi:electron transport complex protein RnfB